MLIVITGAGQGIGAAIAEAFAREFADCRLALLARTQARLDEVAERCRAAGARADAVRCDVTDAAAVDEAARRILGGGPPDVVVNNAGRYVAGSVTETDAEAFRAQIEVNLTGAFLVTRALLPAMVEAGQGHLFYIASVASIRAYPGAAYCAAKHGLLGLARSVRRDYRRHGIRVTALLVGATKTPSWDGSPVPEARLMPAADVAQAVVDAYRMSPRTVVEEIVLRPREGDV